MAAKQKPKKPTMKDVTTAIDQMMSNMNWLKNNMEKIGNLFDLYVLFKGDNDKFKDFLEERKKKFDEEEAKKEAEANEQTEDGQTDDQNSADSSTDQG